MKSDISTPLDEESLKTLITESLVQGFYCKTINRLPDDLDKEKIKSLH